MSLSESILPLTTGYVGVGAAAMCALVMDHFLGEPQRFHPLVGFGRWVNWVEKICRRGLSAVLSLSNYAGVNEDKSDIQPPRMLTKIAGAMAWVIAVLPLAVLCGLLLIYLSDVAFWLWFVANVVILYFTIGGNSLVFHAEQIYHPLQQGDLTLAREKVGLIVSRETATMDEREITSAAVESVLENGNDAVFGALFWFAVAGAPGALIFRLANTLDAMWGYKTERYHAFGFAAAKLDDLLGWIPARLTAFTYAIQGNFQQAMQCWKEQAPQCASPNGGVVMSAGAGALNTRIGGPAVYHGKRHNKIYMGSGSLAEHPVIPLANQLVSRGVVYWVLVIFLIGIM
ncbi:adenosylcobinamide-phosphate synthase CbiB [Photobacterium nomapromontoriensis]|uniref:adenosylcobinamide-phosphate synthase CbiB n=1 Tax=Photobacterium nomapromontoriensis TaxID=2910237 RepID=UPI003D120E10